MSGIFGGGRQDMGGPWHPQQSYVRRGLSEAEQQFLDQANPYTQQYQERLASRSAGSPLETAGVGALSDTLSGKYLYGGAGFNAALDAAKNQILPMVGSSFEKYGRHGSPAEMGVAAGALGDVFAKQYGAERNRMMEAAGMLPQMQQMDYRNIGALGMAGDVNRQLLERYLRLVGANYGQQKPGALGGLEGSILGGIEGGAKGFALSGGNPYIAGVGSVAGGLGPLFQ